MPPGNARRVAVLGGGISGLTAAYVLARARENGAPIEEVLFEAGDRLGGCIQTDHVDGFTIEAGPDSFLSAKPDAAALARDLGLGDALIGSNDATRRTYVVHHGRLVPLPDGLMLLVPTRLWPIVTTPLLTLAGKLAMAKEYFRSKPAANRAEDESVAEFVRRHFGDAMLENVADPLLAGVFGGDAQLLSARSALTRFWEMERTHGSLTRAALAARRVARNRQEGPEGGIFTTLRDGLGSLIQALKARLDPSRVCLRQRVTQIERSPSPANDAPQTGDATRPYTIRCENGSVRDADEVVLALPAYECARLLTGLDAKLAASLATIPYTSALTVALGYDRAVRERLPPGFGFLAPRHEGLRMLACTMVHAKFEGRAPQGKTLLRCFFGGARDAAALSLADDEIIAMARQELGRILKLRAEPLLARAYRWPRSMPQYVVGHEARVRTIQERLDALGGIFLAGNAYTGIGISDCIRTARSAAERAISQPNADES